MKNTFQRIEKHLLNLRLHPLVLIFGIIIIGILGGLIIFMEGNYALAAHLSIIYSFSVIVAISYKAALQEKCLLYAQKDSVIPPRSTLLLLWNVTFFLTLGCLIWLFVQADMRHPFIVSVLRYSNVLQTADLRSEILKQIDMRVHNLGLIFLQPLNLIVSIFFLRSIFLSFASVSLLLLLGTFTLAKAPIIYVLIFVFIFRMVYSPLYFKTALKYLGIISLSVVVIFLSTRYASFDLRSAFKNIGGRILYGEISELPYYFEVFSAKKGNIKSLMPPYLVGNQESAARTVRRHSIQKMLSHIPSENVKYSGILSHNQLMGTYSVIYRWEGKRASGPSRIDGVWVINAGNAPGILRLYWVKNKLDGKISFDVAQGWENLFDVFFDSDSGNLRFTRPISGNRHERYHGTLSGDQLKGTYTIKGKGSNQHWEGTKEKGSERAQLTGIDGLWLIHSDKATGKLELYRTGNKLVGRIWFDVYQQWEDLSNVVFDPRSGQLEFTRPDANEAEKKLYARAAGVANTFFTGEAFAWAGYPGVILSPFLVMAHLIFYVYLFSKIKKTWFTVYVFSFFMYKVFIGIFGGISYFIFSSMHIVLIAFLLLLISWRYLEGKNIPCFNRIGEKLCIL